MAKQLLMLCCTGTGVVAIGGLLLARGGLLADGGQSTSPPPASAVVLATQASADGGGPSSSSGGGWIGVQLKENHGQGVRVSDLFPGGPAAFAGVRAGDILIRIGSRDVNTREAAETAIAHLAPGRSTSLTIERGKRPVELKVTPDSLAEFRQSYISEMMRRDPRDPNYGKHHGISEADISAELVRRLFEQHERMDRTLQELLKEVHLLRKQVAALQK